VQLGGGGKLCLRRNQKFSKNSFPDLYIFLDLYSTALEDIEAKRCLIKQLGCDVIFLSQGRNVLFVFFLSL